jgi:hypothetical protein
MTRLPVRASEELSEHDVTAWKQFRSFLPLRPRASQSTQDALRHPCRNHCALHHSQTYSYPDILSDRPPSVQATEILCGDMREAVLHFDLLFLQHHQEEHRLDVDEEGQRDPRPQQHRAQSRTASSGLSYPLRRLPATPSRTSSSQP